MIYRVSRVRTTTTWHDILVRVPGEDSPEAQDKAREAGEDFLDALDEGRWDSNVNDAALADLTQVAILDDNEPDYDDDEVRWEVELAQDQTRESL